MAIEVGDIVRWRADVDGKPREGVVLGVNHDVIEAYLLPLNVVGTPYRNVTIWNGGGVGKVGKATPIEKLIWGIE